MTSIHPVMPESFANATTKLTKEERQALIKEVLDNAAQKSSLEKTPEADTFEKPRSKAKSVGKGIASFILPGSGQMFEGRFKDGFKDMLTVAGLSLGGIAIGRLGGLNFAKATQAAKTPYGWYAAIALCGLAAIGNIATRIHSAVDAYKGGK